MAICLPLEPAEGREEELQVKALKIPTALFPGLGATNPNLASTCNNKERERKRRKRREYCCFIFTYYYL